MINLNSIEIEGFGSVIDPIKYKIKNPGLNKIEGDNGAGKTTITNALAWVGWGQLVKPKKSSIIPWPHIIDEHYQGTKVTLKFDDGKDKYAIIRCNEYKGKILGKAGKNRLIILKNGKELDEHLRDKKDYQKWIINKIGYSFELFKSTVLFTQELDNLMREDGPTKKKIFDEAFETTFVNNAKKRVEERLESKNSDLEKLNNRIDLVIAKINGVNRSINVIKDFIRDFDKTKKAKITKVNNNLEELNIRKTELEKKKIKYTPKKERYIELQKKLKKYQNARDSEFRLDMRLNGAKEKLGALRLEHSATKKSLVNIQKNCSECGRPLDKESINKVKIGILDKLAKLIRKIKPEQETVNKLEGYYKVAKKKLKRFEKWQKEFDKLDISKINGVDNDLLRIQESIGNNLKELKELKESKPHNGDTLKTLQKEKKAGKLDKTKLIIERKALKKDINIDKWLIKDPLSNSGLKAFIFDSMLGRVNNFLKSYTNIIGFGIKVFIDMSSANKDIRILIERGGDEIPYEDLSKGQKQLANVALSFSLSDTVQSIKPINCIFLDELFESLSSENIEKVGNIITKKAKTKAVHLITHQASFSPPNCTITYVQLDSNNRTKIF